MKVKELGDCQKCLVKKNWKIRNFFESSKYNTISCRARILRQTSVHWLTPDQHSDKKSNRYNIELNSNPFIILYTVSTIISCHRTKYWNNTASWDSKVQDLLISHNSKVLLKSLSNLPMKTWRRLQERGGVDGSGQAGHPICPDECPVWTAADGCHQCMADNLLWADNHLWADNPLCSLLWVADNLQLAENPNLTCCLSRVIDNDFYSFCRFC